MNSSTSAAELLASTVFRSPFLLTPGSNILWESTSESVIYLGENVLGAAFIADNGIVISEVVD